jgi:hypothetical protein
MSPAVRGTLAALVGVAIAVALAAGPAHASTETGAICTVHFVATITPGLTLAESSGTFTTGAETGTLTCTGNFRGHRITGPGTMGFVEQYTAGNCSGHTGKGTLSYSVPTTAGLQHVTGMLSVSRTASVVRAEVRSADTHFSGIGVALFRQGNCFLTPLRQVAVTVTGSISAA